MTIDPYNLTLLIGTGENAFEVIRTRLENGTCKQLSAALMSTMGE